MKRIFEHLDVRYREFDQKPLFTYLRDASVDPEERLKFVPCSAHFVMTFADLYHFFLTENPPKDRFEELINTHLEEEGTHWKWYLADLKNLGLDPQLTFTDSLRFLWGDETIRTRRLAYEVCKLSGGLTSLEKLVMVLAIESTGRVALEAAVPAGQAAAEKRGKNLVYFGNHHLETEQAHTVEEDAVRGSLEAEALDEATCTRLMQLIDQVFGYFGEFVDEAYSLAKSGRGISELTRLAS